MREERGGGQGLKAAFQPWVLRTYVSVRVQPCFFFFFSSSSFPVFLAKAVFDMPQRKRLTEDLTVASSCRVCVKREEDWVKNTILVVSKAADDSDGDDGVMFRRQSKNTLCSCHMSKKQTFSSSSWQISTKKKERENLRHENLPLLLHSFLVLWIEWAANEAGSRASRKFLFSSSSSRSSLVNNRVFFRA